MFKAVVFAGDHKSGCVAYKHLAWSSQTFPLLVVVLCHVLPEVILLINATQVIDVVLVGAYAGVRTCTHQKPALNLL